MQPVIKQTICFLLLSLLSSYACGQEFSYVYIQGDKNTPFYVKLEGEMLPRYGKNYCIIPQLVAGTMHISILFQQNKYPEQYFTINVPDNGFREFLLHKKDEGFALYDLQYKFYLPAGNKEEEDLSPALLNVPAEAAIAYQPPPHESSNTPSPAPAKEQPADNRNTAAGSPRFIDNIELNNQHEGIAERPAQLADTADNVVAADTVAWAATAAQPTDAPIASDTTPAALADTLAHTPPAMPDTTIPEEEPKADTVLPAAGAPPTTTEMPVQSVVGGQDVVFNSDCPQEMKPNEFATIYRKTNERNKDEQKLAYLYSQLDKCYTTQQAKMLAKTLSADAARYTFLQKVYARVKDQARFAALADLFAAPNWKESFLKLIGH